MIKKKLVNSKISPNYKYGYRPFIISFFSLTLSSFLFITIQPIESYKKDYWILILILIAIIDIALIFLIRRTERIELKKHENKFYLEIIKDKSVEEIEINEFDYWWNYNLTEGGRGGEFGLEGSNSGKQGGGAANKINLNIKIKGSKGEIVYLKEKRKIWNETPSTWKYRIDEVSKEKIIHTFKLMKILKELEKVS